ncbi:unnamed protein product [Nezara viridula]|uniref:Sulfotransferase domain-containing protein n=1 Tax=Nezara viridula TaxID=85310 RepID=A0A9P0HFJ9_NEZVI|nr:unnamed protein product [Nezara viridula]
MSDSIPSIEIVEEELNNELKEDYPGDKAEWCYAGETKYLLPGRFADIADELYDFEGRPDDVWIVTFPRSGTTLSQHLVWLLMNNFDYEKANEMNVWSRSPFYEFHLFMHNDTAKALLEDNDPEAVQVLKELSVPAPERLKTMESPRLIKTHLPLTLLPKGVETNKIIYVARNPKDVLPSYYFLLRLWKTTDYKASFLQFWKQFKNGHVPWGPFWSHILEAWDCKDNDNFLFLFYEELAQDLPKAIYKIADFLEIEVTEEQVMGLADHMSISNFSKNKSVNMEDLRNTGIFNESEPSFIRKGKKRERPEEYTAEVEAEIEEWINEHYETTDLRFPIVQ